MELGLIPSRLAITSRSIHHLDILILSQLDVMVDWAHLIKTLPSASPNTSIFRESPHLSNWNVQLCLGPSNLRFRPMLMSRFGQMEFVNRHSQACLCHCSSHLYTFGSSGVAISTVSQNPPIFKRDFQNPYLRTASATY